MSIAELLSTSVAQHRQTHCCGLSRDAHQEVSISVHLYLPALGSTIHLNVNLETSIKLNNQSGRCLTKALTSSSCTGEPRSISTAMGVGRQSRRLVSLSQISQQFLAGRATG